MKKLISSILLFVSFVGITSANADPSAYLEGIANTMIKEIEQNKEALKADNSLAEKLVRDHLLPVIDKESFAKSTLGKTIWKDLTDEQRGKFIDGYINRVINKYAKGLSLYDGQAFEFDKAEFSDKSDKVRVKSEMKQEGSTPLDIYYILKPANDSWLITNMSIAGTSVTKSYRTQFLPRIKEIGFDKFLEELATQTDPEE
ncbi:phospholipid-binding protein MlaC [Aliikangiella sp. G2MR2-5]|uniref:MlaC/ttg2D family ABC transporter substrate-binding protein n=1 Tax=Aliikangiella sp. G2MR2-5 TaxID=2788943 RepID=UPI0018AAD6A4|nr:ABC transporter substrate-binding protein [Aliikangiella sp. G2MR2-5]